MGDSVRVKGNFLKVKAIPIQNHKFKYVARPFHPMAYIVDIKAFLDSKGKDRKFRVKVQWYATKLELQSLNIKLHPDFLNEIPEKELFMTNLIDSITPENLIERVAVSDLTRPTSSLNFDSYSD